MTTPEGEAVSLVDLVSDVIAELDDVTSAAQGAWSRNGRSFAALDGSTLEVRLAEPVVRAALRTPDTEPSTRGPDWLRFAPPVLDQYALDRAIAWLESAWRNAG